MATLKTLALAALLAALPIIAMLAYGLAYADEHPAPMEGAGCMDVTKINCGE